MGSAAALLSQNRDEILRLAALRDAGRVRVFGSAVRGTDTSHSDVDLLILPGEKCGLLEMIAFKLDVEELLGRPVDVVSERALHPVIRERILAEARPL